MASSGEIRIVAIELQAQQTRQLVLRLLTQDGNKLKDIRYRTHPGTNRYYFDLPADPVATLQVRTEDGKDASVSVRAVEVRTDHRP